MLNCTGGPQLFLGEDDAASRFLHSQPEVDAVIRQERTVPPVNVCTI